MCKSDQKIWYEFDLKKSTFSDDISKSEEPPNHLHESRLHVPEPQVKRASW
jgi:hypothetical protein